MPRVIMRPPKNFNSPVEQKVQCTGCGATVGYFKEEVREYHGRDISGGPDGKEWIDCPHCGRQITLKVW